MNNLKELGLTEDNLVWSYDNGDHEYKKDELQYLLNPKGELKCKGDFVWSFENGDYEYKKDEIEYLLNPKGELKCKGGSIWSYPNGDYEYGKDGKTYYYHKEDNYWTINGIQIKDFEEIKKMETKKENLKELGLTEDNLIYSYDNGDCKYEKDGICYLLSPKGELKCNEDFVWSYDNGDCKYGKYETEYLLSPIGKLKCKGSRVCSFYDGSYYYRKDGIEYFYNKEKNYWTINDIKVDELEEIIKNLKKEIKEIKKMNEYLDSRDLEKELIQLEELRDNKEEYDKERLRVIQELKEETENYGWDFGICFIPDYMFKDYCRELAEDCYSLDKNNPLSNHINWESWTNEVKMNYNYVDFEGTTYLWRED